VTGHEEKANTRKKMEPTIGTKPINIHQPEYPALVMTITAAMIPSTATAM